MTYETKSFGITADGQPVTAHLLRGDGGLCATILDYGCTVQSLLVPTADGSLVDVVVGYDTIAEYEQNDAYVGAAIGRVGNRIGGGTFDLNDTTYHLAINNGPNHLHGGLRGFNCMIWHAETQGDTLAFTRISPDGEEGYPGNLTVCIHYRLSPENGLEISYHATCDQNTPISLTNHSYFNLAGGGAIDDHILQVSAQKICENDADCLPTGALLDVAGTAFDFTSPKAIGQDIGRDCIQLKNGNGYDHNFCLDGDGFRHVATLASEASGITMETYTDRPGVQIYSANFLSQRRAKYGKEVDLRHAVCLETQAYPDAIHQPTFPCAVLKKGDVHETKTTYLFKAL